MAKILLVDDSRIMRDLWVRALGEAGNDVDQACDGIEALSKLMKEGFDLVLTDINMPNMDGISPDSRNSSGRQTKVAAGSCRRR